MIRKTKNFSRAVTPKVLPPGTKIYRIVDGDNNVNGRWWSYELPSSKAAWRSDYAVTKYWNENGYYVVHTVGSEGLPVWEGQASSQFVKDAEGNDIESWMVQGGGKQIFSPTAWNDIPSSLVTQPTNWSE